MAALCGFVLTFGTFALFTWPSVEECSGEGSECALAFAAVVTWGIILGLLIGAVAGFVAFVLSSRNSPRRRF
jgi:hypothetical protein